MAAMRVTTWVELGADHPSGDGPPRGRQDGVERDERRSADAERERPIEFATSTGTTDHNASW